MFVLSDMAGLAWIGAFRIRIYRIMGDFQD